MRTKLPPRKATVFGSAYAVNVAGEVREIHAALDRLSHLLPDKAPELWATLRPPVAAHDLERLRRVVDPYDVPDAVVALLQWADGQTGYGIWWPALNCGPLLSATRAADHYTWLNRETERWQWTPLWLPIAHEGWSQAAVEMMGGRPGVVIDGSFPDPEVRVIGPSLAALLEAAADLIEAGVPVTPSPEEPLQWQEREDQRRRIVEARNAHESWDHWPHDRVIALEPAGWPPHWREAIGLPPETDYPHPPARPIGEVLSDAVSAQVEATVEGVVIERVLVEGVADKTTVVTLRDATGSIRVVVAPDAPGRYWAAWLERRIQIDLRVGPCEDDERGDRSGTQPAADLEGPEYGTAKALEVRFAVQV